MRSAVHLKRIKGRLMATIRMDRFVLVSISTSSDKPIAPPSRKLLGSKNPFNPILAMVTPIPINIASLILLSKTSLAICEPAVSFLVTSFIISFRLFCNFFQYTEFSPVSYRVTVMLMKIILCTPCMQALRNLLYGRQCFSRFLENLFSETGRKRTFLQFSLS